MKEKKILICGFSGAGKTSFLKELEFQAPTSDWEYNDLDQLILEKFRFKTILELVQSIGWEEFRLSERQLIEATLKNEGNQILALGGGAMTPLLLELFSPVKSVRICYLHAEFQDCWERLRLDSQVRPLLKLGEMEFRKLYNERQKTFERISWRIDNPKGSDLSELAKKFWDKVSLS